MTRPDNSLQRYGLIFGSAGVGIVLLLLFAVGLIWFIVWLGWTIASS